VAGGSSEEVATVELLVELLGVALGVGPSVSDGGDSTGSEVGELPEHAASSVIHVIANVKGR
jgi:hypothetical protein